MELLLIILRFSNCCFLISSYDFGSGWLGAFFNLLNSGQAIKYPSIINEPEVHPIYLIAVANFI